FTRGACSMRTKCFVAAIAAACALAPSAPTRADLVVNGGFETGGFTGWTDEALIIFDPAICGTGLVCQSIINAQLAATRWLNLSTNPYEGSRFAGAQFSATLSQTLPTTSGETYQVSFAYNPLSSGNGLNVLWDNVAVFNIPESGTAGWTSYSLNLLA